MAVGEEAAKAEALVPMFQFQKLLTQDQAGRRIVLLGTIDNSLALLLSEKAPFATDEANLSALSTSLAQIQNLGANDIYAWFLAWHSKHSAVHSPSPPDLKITLIYPCTEKHIKKYSAQGVRTVTETPSIYRDHVRPYMQKQHEQGRLNWVFNVIEGRAEQEDVIYREHGEEGFLLAPDLNWDRKTLASLHLLGIVERRDIWSLRDLTKDRIPWLKHMRSKLIDATIKLYPSIEPDQLKLYVHYQPTYYHFHIHVVHVMLEGGLTQAVGKAFGLENIISQLEMLPEGKGMADVSLTYHVGESSDLWADIFRPLKEAGKLL